MQATLRTSRLVLRQWRADDLPLFAELNADPEVMEHFPAPMSRQESDNLATRIWHTWTNTAGNSGRSR